MTVAAPERGQRLDSDGFDARRVSPSRVNALLSCGVAFKLKYLDGLPEEISGSSALFGSVVHLALERWAVDTINPESGEIVAGRTQDLLRLMRQAWLDFCDDKAAVLGGFIREYQAISTEVIRAEHDAAESFKRRNKGKESKAPRMTKEFKTSPAAAKLNQLVGDWLDRLNTESPYRFTEFDPLPKLYDESLVLAKRYEAKWAHLPPAFHAELGFDEPWRGFTLHGFIDSIEPLNNCADIGIVDYKTYAKEPAQHKDWRQVVMYDVAVRSLMDRGVLPPLAFGQELLIGIDYVRLGVRKFWRVGPADHDRLERELNAYLSIVESGSFLPAEKGRNPDFCPFPSSCCLRTTVAAGGSCEPVEVAA